jgi:SAM-dependent methyltransferase
VSAPLSLRLAAFAGLIQAHQPPPARVLEIGCGDGALALALADDGYEVTAIDPRAPEGPIFRQVSLEAFDDDEPFDAAVASVSLHHLDPLAAAVDRISALLRPDGLLLVTEFAKERIAGATAAWYHHQRQAQLSVTDGAEPLTPDLALWQAQLAERLAHVHPSTALRPALAARFTEEASAWTPYLHDYGLHEAVEPLERALIQAGAIQAVGYVYAGRRR